VQWGFDVPSDAEQGLVVGRDGSVDDVTQTGVAAGGDESGVLERGVSTTTIAPGRGIGRAVLMLRNSAAVVMFAGLFVLLAFLSPAFLHPQNLLNIVSENAPTAIVAAAVTLVIIGGNFDLSTGSIVAVTNLVAAIVMVHTGSVVLALATAPALGLAMGAVNGAVISGFRIHSFLGTLATSLVYSGLALLITGGALVNVTSTAFATLGEGYVGPVADQTFVLIGFVLFMMALLNRTVIGRYIFAVGGNSVAAELSGVRVWLACVTSFAMSGLAAGLAGAILVSSIMSGQPTQGSDITLDAIAGVILGGTSIYGGAGAVWRTMVGVYLLALIGNGFDLMSASPFWEELVEGLVIISAVSLSAARAGRGSRRAKAFWSSVSRAKREGT
jgi:ribose transport system permease protein